MAWACQTSSYEIGSSVEVLILNNDHIEGIDPVKKGELEFRRKIKIKASMSDEPPRKIISEFSSERGSAEEIANSGTYEANRQVINRSKKKSKPEYPKAPECLAEIDLPEWLTLTNQNKDLFIIFDSGKDDNERFLMFGTKNGVKLLEKNDCFADGTFDTTPRLFSQVYTIHALIEGTCVPCVFALLPRKTEEIYIRMLSVLKEQMLADPRSITSDFERSFINAVSKVFVSTKQHGCYFHFKQCCYRKIQNLGLLLKDF